MKRFLMLSSLWVCLVVSAGLPVWATKPAAAYLQALDLYAEGRYQEASTALLRARPRSSVSKDDAVYALWRDISLKLAVEDPEALIPIVGLLTRAHARLLQLDAAGVAALLEDMIEVLLRNYLKRSTAPDAPQIASRLLTHVAIDIRDLLHSFHAVKTLERALVPDPDNVAALQALAALAEKDGDFAEAARRLEHLLLVDSESFTARLRLGIVERKLSNVEQAFADLRRVIDASREPWLVIVAYQETAKGRLALQETEQAIQALEEALERFPGQERLRLQLAFLRGERFSSPASLLAGLTDAPWRPELTPRVLYNNWPDEEVVTARSRAAADIEDRLDNLKRVLYAW